MKAQTKHSNRGTDGNLALVPGRGGWRRLCLVPGVEMEVAEDLARDTPLERSQRPSTRPTTARESTARTGEPLWPRFTGWLRRKTSAAGEDFSSLVDS